MRLFEATKDLENSYVTILMNECLAKFDQEIYEVDSTDDFVFHIGYNHKSETRQGVTMVGWDPENNQFECEISINANLLKEGLEDILINTVWHELCHYAVFKEFAKRDIFIKSNKFEKLKAKPEFEAEYLVSEEDGGHGKQWLEFAEKVNTILKPNLKLSAYCAKEEVNRVLAAHDDEEPDFEIRCEGCDFKISALSFDKFNEGMVEYVVMLFVDSKKKLPNFLRACCKKCGKPLYIIINNKELEEFLKENASDILREIVMNRFFGDGEN